MIEIDWLKLRAEANLTQREIAEKAGISESSYHGYENGYHVPSIYRTVDMLEVLGYTLKLEEKV